MCAAMSEEATSEAKDENQLSPEFVAMLVCPESRKPLVQKGNRLLCKESRKAYRIEDGIPILLIDEAERITDAELADLD
jgi:uncharacterized protein YbaR (Trm112 family)